MRIAMHWSVVVAALSAACSSPEPGKENAGPPDTKTAPSTSNKAARTDTPPRAESIRGIARPLKTDTTSLALVDRVDVGNDSDEQAHQYAIQGQTFRGTHDFELDDGKGSYLEDGRATNASEQFEIKVIPRQDNLLVKAVDTLSRDQKVRVLVDGKNAGEMAIPNGGANRYAEVTFPLTASLVGNRSKLTVRFEYVSGAPDTNSLGYWVFAKPDRKLEAPVNINVAGYSLVDRIDVGGEQDEAAHQYVIDKQNYAGTHQFQWPVDGTPFLETGRATRSFESFRVKVKPGVDNLLVKAFDTLSKDQKIRVSIDGKTIGDWTLPDGASRYGESAFIIPAKAFGDRREVTVKVEFVSGSIDTNSFYYWVYAKAVDQTSRIALEAKP